MDYSAENALMLANHEIIHGTASTEAYAKNVPKTGTDRTQTSPRDNYSTDWRSQNRANQQRGSDTRMLDRYTDSDGYQYDNASDYLYGNIRTVHGDPLMYSRNNRNGGTIVLSTDPINLNSFRNTLDYYNQSGRRVTILSGSHGTPDGQSALGSKRFWNRSGNNSDLADRNFYREDVRTARNYNNVKVYDISRLSQQKFRNILNSRDVIICAWCFSERSNDVIEAIR